MNKRTNCDELLAFDDPDVKRFAAHRRTLILDEIEADNMSATVSRDGARGRRNALGGILGVTNQVNPRAEAEAGGSTLLFDGVGDDGGEEGGGGRAAGGGGADGGGGGEIKATPLHGVAPAAAPGGSGSGAAAAAAKGRKAPHRSLLTRVSSFTGGNTTDKLLRQRQAKRRDAAPGLSLMAAKSFAKGTSVSVGDEMMTYEIDGTADAAGSNVIDALYLNLISVHETLHEPRSHGGRLVQLSFGLFLMLMTQYWGSIITAGLVVSSAAGPASAASLEEVGPVGLVGW